MNAAYASNAGRVDWVDYAKGFCIVFVVMMHSTLGVEDALGREGWLHAVVAFARPFRMPDFFLISGLFLARVIDRDWRTYLDRKVVHFAYFYVLWMTIQFAVKAPGLAAGMGWSGVAGLYLESFIEPFGTLWFIYLLPIFFVVIKATRNVPVWLVWSIGAALEIAHFNTGWTAIDEFANRFVYCYTGYVFATVCVHAHGACSGPAAARARRAVGVGPYQRQPRLRRLRDVAVRLARPRPHRRRGGGFRFGPDGDERPVPAAALLRAQLHRHLPRLLPADGRDPYAADQDRPHSRHRHHGGRHYRGRRHRAARPLLAGAWHAVRLPVRAPGHVLAHAQAAARVAAGGIAPSHLVIAGLDPAIHGGAAAAWTPGSSPGVTKENWAVGVIHWHRDYSGGTLIFGVMPAQKSKSDAKPAAAPAAPSLKKGDHVFLVDGSGYIFRAYHALPPINRKSDGLQLNAVFGFCNMLWKLLRDMKDDDKPTHLAIVFDLSERTFRTEMYPDYKAHRPDPPDDLRPQFALIREAVHAFDLPCLEQKGFEADDLIATYVRQACEAGATATIVSSDKDLMQLVSDCVIMYDTMKDKKIGIPEVIEKFGVPPEKVIEVQALIGDSTDNVPGVPGIGVKTAAQLIGEYGDLETLLKRAGEIKQDKRRQTLIDNADKARLSKKLVTLDDKVKLDVPIEDLAVHEPDHKRLIAFLKAMEFSSLTRRVAEFADIDVGQIEPQAKLGTGERGGPANAAAESQTASRPASNGTLPLSGGAMALPKRPGAASVAGESEMKPQGLVAAMTDTLAENSIRSLALHNPAHHRSDQSLGHARPRPWRGCARNRKPEHRSDAGHALRRVAGAGAKRGLLYPDRASQGG